MVYRTYNTTVSDTQDNTPPRTNFKAAFVHNEESALGRLMLLLLY